jgi:hypothetical protein
MAILSLVMGSKRVDHWTSGTVYECSEIAGSPHFNPFPSDLKSHLSLLNKGKYAYRKGII